MTCPNRDGTLGDRGCIFCSRGGSGDFTPSALLPVSVQLEEAKRRVSGKIHSNQYIAYFQAFTNTYAPVDYLRKLYHEAIAPEEIVGLSIATRPDCLNDEILMLLSQLQSRKPVFVELGLQTIHEETARFIRRGYDLSVFETAVHHLHERKINVVVHLILGLPGEDENHVLASIRYLNTLPVDGVKLQLLHILKNTDLAGYYEHSSLASSITFDTGQFSVLSLEEYTRLVFLCIERLRPDIVIHRITGDGNKKELLAPLWSGDKKKVLGYMNRYFEEHDLIQGRKYENGF